jgi:hypothetical protein
VLSVGSVNPSRILSCLCLHRVLTSSDIFHIAKPRIINPTNKNSTRYSFIIIICTIVFNIRVLLYTTI